MASRLGSSRPFSASSAMPARIRASRVSRLPPARADVASGMALTYRFVCAKSSSTYGSVCASWLAPPPGERMTAATAPARPFDRLEVVRLWALHSLCFVLPLTTLGFLLSAPHGRAGALAWLLVVVASVFADGRSGDERRQPAPMLPGWPFDSVLYALFAFQLLNLALLVRLAATQDFFRMD